MMISRFFLIVATAALLSNATAAPVSAPNRPVPKYKLNVPPSVELAYAVKAKQSGIPLDGDARVKWHVGSGKFELVTEMRAMLIGKIIDARSEGRIDEYGLAPTIFTEKRFHKATSVTSFDRARKTISFSGSSETYPIKGGEQDRNSAIWQLISVARAAPKNFTPGSKWSFFVVGQRDADPWTFKVIQQEKINTPLGDLNAIHIVKVTKPDAKNQQLDIWLAPSLEWYPVRLRYTGPDADFIEQTLVKITKNPS